MTYLGLQGHVATITSAAEQSFLSRMAWVGPLWIGGSDIAVEGVWRWTAGPETNTLVSATFWLAGQPNGGNASNCIQFSGTGWDDADCAANNLYLIEYECQTWSTTLCPVSNFTGHFYSLSSGNSSFLDASLMASQSTYNGLPGHIATINTQLEYDFILNTFSSAAMWISGSDNTSEGVWSFTAGPERGLVITGTFWAPGQPNNGTSANCLSTSSAGWDDQACNVNLPYLIEYECQTATTSACPRML